MKILFAPIGDPSGYREVEYAVEIESEGKEVKCKTKVSFKAIQKALNIDKVVVYAGLSLCKDTNKPDQSSLYLECSNEVKRDVKNVLQLQEEDVLVAPNVFGNKVRQVDGKTTLYFNYVYYNSLKILEETNPDEVYIDITHGVNYMPLLATEAIKLASYVYAIDKKNLTIRIYNSEPVIGKSEGPYHISKVFEEKVNTRISLLVVLTPFLQSNIKNLIINKLSKELKCDKDIILPSANALFSGIFLFLLMNKNEIMKCMESVEQRIKVLDYAQPSINLALEGTTLVYKDKMDIELSYLHALLKVLSKIIGSRKVEENCVKLSDIRDLTEKYYTSELIRSAVLNEIDKLKGNRDKLTSKPKLLAKILLEEKIMGEALNRYLPAEILLEEKVKDCEFNKRNLFAHGGFEKNITYVWKHDNEICVSYRDCLENVKKQLE